MAGRRRTAQVHQHCSVEWGHRASLQKWGPKITSKTCFRAFLQRNFCKQTAYLGPTPYFSRKPVLVVAPLTMSVTRNV